MTIRARFPGVVAALALALVTITGTLAQNATPIASGSPEASPAVQRLRTLLGVGSPDDGCVIFINALDGDIALDLYIDGLKAVDDLTFGDVSGYFSLPAGDYTFDLVPAEQAFASSLFTLTDEQIEAGIAYEFAAVGTAADPQLLVSPVDLAPLAPNTDVPVGNTRIRAVNGAADAPSIDAVLIGGDIAERVGASGLPGCLRLSAKGRRNLSRATLHQRGRFHHIAPGRNHVCRRHGLQSLSDRQRGQWRAAPVAGGGRPARRQLDKTFQPPALVSEISEVSNPSIYQGDCAQLSGQQAFERSGSGYAGTGPGTLAPGVAAKSCWRARRHTGVVWRRRAGRHELRGLLGGRTVSVVVHDAATGGGGLWRCWRRGGKGRPLLATRPVDHRSGTGRRFGRLGHRHVHRRYRHPETTRSTSGVTGWRGVSTSLEVVESGTLVAE
ncbi:MAG: DUF4397 domain-containing protein [Thermomicrobiales bacterium]